MIRFVAPESVEELHVRLIRRSGGSHGLRDRTLLESAVARARNKGLYEPTSTVAELAASLSFGLITNHAFVDGNKRIGLATLIGFLRVNGYWLTSSEHEETAMVLRVASGAMAEKAWTEWVAGKSARMA